MVTDKDGNDMEVEYVVDDVFDDSQSQNLDDWELHGDTLDYSQSQQSQQSQEIGPYGTTPKPDSDVEMPGDDEHKGGGYRNNKSRKKKGNKTRNKTRKKYYFKDYF